MLKTETRWFVRPLEKPAARLTLFCFPHAGGASAAYHRWGQKMDAEVQAIQLPLREGRMNEAPLPSLHATVEAIVNAMTHDPRAALGQRPFAFFGHSMGAMLAYETACALRRRGLPMPAHLFVSGRTAPDFVPDDAPMHMLPDDAFIDQLSKRYGGLPQVLLQEPDLMALFLPMLRADLKMLETHRFVPSPPLHVPILAYTGQADRRATPALVEAWSAFTTDWRGVRAMPGDHFYLQDLTNPLFDDLNAECAGLHGPAV